MRVTRQIRGLRGLQAMALCLVLALSGCKVYTVNKADLESELSPARGERGLSIGYMYRKVYRNGIDTLVCRDEIGHTRLKKISPDSKITIFTKQNQSIRFYAKSLYIYKGQFLIGERTAPRLRGPNYFPVRLADIDRIEVTGFSF